MLIQERLQLILKMHTITPATFADKLGVQRSNVSHVLSGRNKPGLDFLEKILVQFPRVNAHWLITGEMPAGALIEERENGMSQMKNSKTDEELNSTSNGSELVKIVEIYRDGTFKEFFPKN